MLPRKHFSKLGEEVPISCLFKFLVGRLRSPPEADILIVATGP